VTDGLSDLGRAREESGEVLAVEQLGGGLVEITARLPHLAVTARPGEFAQLRCWDGIEPLLRRPFSVAWTEADCCSFVLEAVGVGTRLIVGLRPGDTLHSLGPLGNGYTTDPTPLRAVVVSGGLGCAPFPLLIRELRRQGCPEVVVLSGARTASRLYPDERFRRGDAAVSLIEATDDGSRGHRGVITDLIPAACAEGTSIFGCGPNPMLGALAEAVRHLSVPPWRAEVSLEAPMGCGFGTCLGCALPVVATPSAGRGAVVSRPPGSAPAWDLCCRRGPVMEVGEVAWPELLAMPPAHVA
jgi:dihydroorotate dehydrogenase electron transfer subunit